MGFYEIFGGFQPNGTDDPTVFVGVTESFSVTRTGVGTFSVAIADSHVGLAGMQLGYIGGSGTMVAATLQGGVVDLASTPKTYELLVYDDAGALMDLAAEDNRLITFNVMVQY